MPLIYAIAFSCFSFFCLYLILPSSTFRCSAVSITTAGSFFSLCASLLILFMRHSALIFLLLFPAALYILLDYTLSFWKYIYVLMSFSLYLLYVHFALFGAQSYAQKSFLTSLLVFVTPNRNLNFFYSRYQSRHKWEQVFGSSPEITPLLPCCDQLALMCAVRLWVEGWVYWWGLYGTSLCFTTVTMIAVYCGCRLHGTDYDY